MKPSKFDRYSEQEKLVPRKRILQEVATLIGVGTIGRQVALNLAALGVPKLQLIDRDVVGRMDVTSQGYLTADVGRPKVEATADMCQQIEHLLQVVEIKDRFRSTHRVGTSLFCCVDSMSTRAAIWHSLGHRAHFWADGRIVGQTIRILVASSEHGRTHYATTLSRSTRRRSTPTGIYASQLAASLLVYQFARYLRKLPSDLDATFDLRTGEYKTAALLG